MGWWYNLIKCCQRNETRPASKLTFQVFLALWSLISYTCQFVGIVPKFLVTQPFKARSRVEEFRVACRRIVHTLSECRPFKCEWTTDITSCVRNGWVRYSLDLA